MTDTGRIAKYVIERRLGTGGMAEVFKCRLTGIGGFDKVLVVKRILPHLAEDEEFVAMFLDEARIAANLNHPNVVHIFEIGQDNDGSPYIAMEFVRGPTFAQIIRTACKTERIDIAKMVRIVIGAAQGLEYAHNAKGSTGEPLQIVHRDVSPHNIMVSLEGVTKILDFGVARADGRLSSTRGAAVKGKARFMAPELLMGQAEAIDRRADVFSLGVCLYMATTGAWPFNGASDALIMEAIVRGQYKKPTERVKGFAPELEAIIAWALEKNPAERCPDCRTLAQRLTSWLEASGAGSTEKDVGDWVGSLFPDMESDGWGSGLFKTPTGLSGPNSLVTGQRPVREGSGSAPGLSSPRNDVVARVTAAGKAKEAQAALAQRQAVAEEAGFQPPPNEEAFAFHISESMMAMKAPRKTVSRFVLAGIVLLMVGVVAAVVGSHFLRQAPEPEARPFIEAARKAISDGKLPLARELIERARTVPNLRSQEAIDVANLRDALRGAELLDDATQALAASDETKALAALDELEKQAPGTADANALRARIEGKPAPASPEVERAPPTVRVEPAPSYRRPVRKRVVAAAGAALSKLTVRSEPAGASVYVDDDYVGTTPLLEVTLDTGEHLVAVTKKGFLRREEEVVVSGKPVVMSMSLTPEPPQVVPPRLKLTSSVPARIAIDGRSLGNTPIDTDALAAGRHTVVAVAEGHEPLTRELELVKGETLAVALELKEARPPEQVMAKAEAPATTRQPDPNGPIASCPDGSSLMGNPPPTGDMLWCADEHGVRNGRFIRWHGNGRKAEQGEFYRGKKNGLWIEYFEDGTERDRMTWRRGVKTW